MPTASHPHRHASFLVVIVPVVLAALGLAACSSTSTPAPRGAATSSTTARPTTTTTRTTSPSSTSTTTGTQEVAYDPYTAQGTANPTLQVTQTVSGTCVGAGVAGATSYRCFAQPDNEVYDPCFAPPHATQGPLLCVPAPNVTDVVQFDVGALPAPPSGAPASRVWAMQLANGQVCVLVDAAWSGLGPFACPTP
ncbi:MAG TPA: hypothetical protein VEG62_07785, partial [Acidimicrobiales bacterium]|nr:hypothetical protein [Acidimicrobiales bacterium]